MALNHIVIEAAHTLRSLLLLHQVFLCEGVVVRLVGAERLSHELRMDVLIIHRHMIFLRLDTSDRASVRCLPDMLLLPMSMGRVGGVSARVL